jgi:hypothetical protein
MLYGLKMDNMALVTLYLEAKSTPESLPNSPSISEMNRDHIVLSSGVKAGEHVEARVHAFDGCTVGMRTFMLVQGVLCMTSIYCPSGPLRWLVNGRWRGVAEVEQYVRCGAGLCWNKPFRLLLPLSQMRYEIVQQASWTLPSQGHGAVRWLRICAYQISPSRRPKNFRFPAKI